MTLFNEFISQRSGFERTTNYIISSDFSWYFEDKITGFFFEISFTSTNSFLLQSLLQISNHMS